jgi:hypothetical protein
MFSSTIGRLRFFFYSVAVLVAEIVSTILCIAGTMGISGLAESRPGPSREGLALAVLLASIGIVVVRSNFAWRRSRDANGSRWILWGYVIFSAIFALLQAGTLLVYDFDGGDNSNLGLNMLGLAIFGLWVQILFAKPAGGGSRDPGAYAGFDDPGPAPRSLGAFDAPAVAQARPSSAAPVAARGGQTGRPSFGKRGLA